MSLYYKSFCFSLLFIFTSVVQSQSLPSFELNSDWLMSIESLVKMHQKIPVNKQKKVLIFSLHTGYKHWTIPHTEAVMEIIAQSTGAFEVSLSKDITDFEKKELSKYDVVILNNNCSKDLIWFCFLVSTKIGCSCQLTRSRNC